MSLSAWLNVRPGEVRPVTVSFWGAFLVIAFLVLARSLREAFYLTTFPVESLPYVTIAVAVLSIPTVGLFVRQLSHHEPRRVLRAVVVGLGVGLAALWPVAARLEAAHGMTAAHLVHKPQRAPIRDDQIAELTGLSDFVICGVGD